MKRIFSFFKELVDLRNGCFTLVLTGRRWVDHELKWHLGILSMLMKG